MAEQILNIKIIDTNENELLDITEITSVDAPVLNYNGGDDKFTFIMASVLTFNMEVNDGSDAKFIHLFTGNETRYKVLLNDITDEANPVNLWQGFLFPEQYSESYSSYSFFVDFTATDGLGQLKNKYLSDDFYTDTKSVTHIIAECLKLTGTEFPILLAPAIENATVQFEVEKLDIPTDIFIDENDKKSAYDMLEDCLKTLSCCLHHYKGYWYIIGFNRLNQIFIDCEQYDTNGSYQGNITIDRKNSIVTFIDAADITIIPPFKTVSVDWSPNNENDLLKSDIVEQRVLPSNVNYSTDYWNAVYSEASTYTVILSNNTGGGLYETDSKFTYGIYNVTMFGYLPLTNENLEDNYISLIDPVFVNAEWDDVLQVSLAIAVKLRMGHSATDDDITDLKNRVIYKIFLDEEVVMSNATSFGTDEELDFEFTKGSETFVEGKVDLKNIVITRSGYIDIRLYPVVITDSGFTNPVNVVSYKTLELQIQDELKSVFQLTRNIDFSLKHSVDLNIGSSLMDVVTNKLYVDDSVEFTGVEIDYDAVDHQIAVLGYYRESTSWYYNGQLFEFWSTIVLFSETDFNYARQYPDSLYIKRQGTGEIVTASPWLYYRDEENDLYGMTQEEWTFTNVFQDGDELFIIRPAETVTETDRHYLLSTWKTFNYQDSDTYLNSLIKVYHNTQPTSLKTINGLMYGLAWPLDLLEFLYNNTPSNYQVANATLNLSLGTTNVTLIEAKNENITDYESE